MHHKLATHCVLGFALLAAGCASSLPRSTVEGISTERTDPTQYPTSLIGVDGKRLSPPYVGPVSVAPGQRKIELIALPTSNMREPAIIRFELKVEACKRYFIVAAKSSPLSRDWMPVVDRIETVADCKPEEELRKAGLLATK